MLKDIYFQLFAINEVSQGSFIIGMHVTRCQSIKELNCIYAIIIFALLCQAVWRRRLYWPCTTPSSGSLALPYSGIVDKQIAKQIYKYV